MSFKENKLSKYLIDSVAELKKVSWPTKKEVVKHTAIVIGVSLFIAAFLGLLDFGFTRLLTVIL